MSKTKKIIFGIIAVFLVLAIAAGTYLLFFFNNGVKVVIASRTSVINYFDDKGITEYLNNKLGINIQWKDYGADNVFEAVKEDATKEAGEKPDAYLGLNLSSSEFSSIAEDVFFDITNIIYTHTTEYKSIMESYGDKLENLKVNDKIFSYPSFTEDFVNSYPQKIWINSAWLNKIGESAPTNLDQLYTVLKKFKTEDPNGNGEADEVPLGAAYAKGGYYNLGFILNSFITTSYTLDESSEYINVSNGTVYTAVTDDKYKNALKYIKKLVDEGLISKDLFDADKTKLAEGNSAEAKYGIIPALDINSIFDNIDRANQYTALAPISGDNTATIVKTNYAKNGAYMVGIEADSDVFQLMLDIGDELLKQEGTLSVLYGIEGEGWNQADGSVNSLGGTEATWKQSETANFNPTAIKDIVPYWYSKDVIMAQQAKGDGSLNNKDNWSGYLNKITRETYEPIGSVVKDQFINKEIVFTEEQEAILTEGETDIRKEISSYIAESAKAFILGEKSLEKDWENYIETLKEKGLNTILEFYQVQYDSK